MNFNILDKIGTIKTATPGAIISSSKLNWNFQHIKDVINQNVEAFKEFFLDIDDTPTDGSDNLVTSNGVYNSIHNTIEINTDRAVKEWLDNHPEATTTVQDGSLTYEKLNDSLLSLLSDGTYKIIDASNNLGEKVSDALVDYDTIIIPDGSYNLDRTITLSSRKKLIVYGTITYSGNGAAIELLDAYHCFVFVNKVNAPNGSCISIRSVNDLCELHEIHSIDLRGKRCIDIVTEGTYAVQYINLFNNYLLATDRAISIVSEVNGGWCGEIKLFGGTVNGRDAVGIYTDGTQTGLRVFGVGFENLDDFMMINGKNEECCFYGCRCESVGKIYFSGIVTQFLYNGGIIYKDNIDYSSLEETHNIEFNSNIFNSEGTFLGDKFIINNNNVGFVPYGRKEKMKEYYSYSSGDVIGEKKDISPRIAIINNPGNYTISDCYSTTTNPSVLIFIHTIDTVNILNKSGEQILSTSGRRSVYRLTASENNNYFCPKGFIVEKVMDSLI